MDLLRVVSDGPSRGVLDVLFGAEKPQEGKSEGFQPLMDFIKQLDQHEESGRTDEETATGKEAIDYRSLQIPGFFPNLPVNAAAKAAEELTAGNQSPAAQADGASQAASLGDLPKVDAQLVNGMLKEKALPELSPEEMKLLQAVNEQVAERNQEQAAMSGEDPLAKLISDVSLEELTGNEATPAERALLGLPAKEDKSQASAAGLRGEGEKAAPAKKAQGFVSTEAYLQLHGQRGEKLAKKEDAADAREANRDLPKLSGINNAAATQQVVEKGSKGRDFFGAKEDSLKLDPKGEEELSGASGLFTNDLHAQLKGGGNGNVKEVFLRGTTPQAQRAELLGEVTQNVNLTALKGGGEMRLVIRPDGLGELKLKVETRDGKVGVHVTAENEEVAKMLRSGSQDLESSLRDQSLSLAKFEVAVKADAPVASTDVRSNLADQFSQGSQPGFDQQPRFGGGWDGSAGEQRNGAERREDAYGVNTSGRPAARARSFQNTAARDSSGRLNVVA